MLPVKVSLNIKEEHDVEHLRLMVVAVIKLGETFEASVTLCYLFVRSCPCFMLCVCVCTVCVHVFVLTPFLLLLFVKTSLKTLPVL